MAFAITLALYALCAAGLVLCAQYLVHMLQLEGYKNKSFIRWLAANAWRVVRLPLLFGIFYAAVKLTLNLSLPSGLAVEITGGALLALYFLTALVCGRANRVKNAKKPLVYTGRVKRLYVFLALVGAALTAGLYALDTIAFKGTPFGGMCLFALLLLAPLAVVTANMVAMPVEAAVRRWYWNNAKRMLEQRPDLIRIGITGSYGKTSCKFILGTLLAEKYDVLVPPSSFNTPMGLTRVVREQLKASHEVFIAEMGARHMGDIAELCGLVYPKYGLLTSVGPQHLETFGSIERVAKTKYELIEALPKDGCAFFPADNEICRGLYEKTDIEKHLFGVDWAGEMSARAENIAVGPDGSRFDIVLMGERIPCETRLLGRHNIANIVGCACVAAKLGLTSKQIRIGIRKLQPVEHRLQLLPPRGGIAVIDDAFNANPSGVRAAMDVLKAFPGRRIVVTPGMVELGAREEQENRAFGEYMAGAADIVYLVGPKHTKPIYDGLAAAGFDEANIRVCRSLDEASQQLWQEARPGDVVLFENDLPDNYNE